MSAVSVSDSGRKPWARLDASVGQALGERLEAIVAAMTEGVIRAVPEFATIDNARFRRDAAEAVRVAVNRFVMLTGTDDPALTPQLREAFVGLGAAEAREERSPDVLLSGLRVSARLLLRDTVDAVARRGEVTTEQIVDIAEATTAFIDELVAASTEGFAVKVRELAGERDRHTHRLAEVLLGGGASEPVVNSAAAAVGWTNLGRLLPVVMPVEEAREARFRFRSDGLVVERGDHVLVLVQEGPRTERAELSSRVHARDAVVGPTTEWPDLPEAVRLTELTSRLLRVDSAEPAFVDDYLPQLALKGEPTALSVLARRRLAPFSGVPENQREQLLDTVQSWLCHWGARTVVADELFIHPQTVSYRMRRVRQLVGPEFEDPSVRFELMLVLADRAQLLR
jgi:hypothetical protein